MIVLLALLLLVLCMVVGIPIPLSFLASAALVCLVDGSSPIMLFSYGFNNMNSVLLLSIPLFVLAGSLIDKGGLGEKLIGGLYKLCRGSKAALGTVTIIACAVFGAVSGSSSATLSCIGSIMEPRLREAGYKPGLIGGVLASSGVLGIMIPPSILMILYAWGTGASVLACFLSTIIPGIIYRQRRSRSGGSSSEHSAGWQEEKGKKRDSRYPHAYPAVGQHLYRRPHRYGRRGFHRAVLRRGWRAVLPAAGSRLL